MSEYDIAEEYRRKHANVFYPPRPAKPRRESFDTNAAHGKALDEYEQEMTAWKTATQEARKKADLVGEEFKAAIGKEFGILEHPKFNQLYSIAYSHGHSAGFSEIAIYVGELAPLLQEEGK